MEVGGEKVLMRLGIVIEWVVVVKGYGDVK